MCTPVVCTSGIFYSDVYTLIGILGKISETRAIGTPRRVISTGNSFKYLRILALNSLIDTCCIVYTYERLCWRDAPPAAEEVAGLFDCGRRLVFHASHNLHYTTHTPFLANLSQRYAVLVLKYSAEMLYRVYSIIYYNTFLIVRAFLLPPILSPLSLSPLLLILALSTFLPYSLL